MYLKSISLKNFKKFSGLIVSFPADITIIQGPNEQGKSTLLSAIFAGFFYDPKKSNKDISALKSWNSDKLYEISLAIENNGEDILLHKNFETGEQYLENKTIKETLKTFKEIGDYLYKIGALRSQALFENTACIMHDTLPQLEKGSKHIAQALQELVTASGQNISADSVLKKAEVAIADMQKGLRQQAKYPGLLKQLEEKIAALQIQKEKYSAELNEIREKGGQLDNFTKTFEEIKNNLEIKESQYGRNNEYFKVVSEIQKLNSQLDKTSAGFRMLEEIKEKKDQILKQLGKMKGLERLDLAKFYNQKEALWTKKEKLSHFQKEAAELSNKKAGKKIHFKKTHIAVSGALFALGFLGFLDPRLFSAWFLFLIVFVYSFLLKHGLEIHTENIASAEISQLVHDISLLEKQLSQILADHQARNEEELIAKVEFYNQNGQELEKLESKEEGILRGISLKDLQKERDEFFKKIAIEEAKISEEQKVSPPLPQAQRQLEIDIKRLKEKILELNKAMIQTETIVLKGRVSQEDLVKLEEEIEAILSRKSAAERKLKALEVLSLALSEAQQKTAEKSKVYIEEYMRRYLPLITDGKYSEVKVKNDLSFEVWSDEKKDMIVPDENLSRGALDQFYLIARLAILDLLNKGAKSIVLLDDPFHNFDAQRRVKAREILADLSRKFQFIIFTHSDEYNDWGEVIKI